MTPAAWPRPSRLDTRLLHVDPPSGSFSDYHFSDLPSLLRRGDLLVVNDAATVPASLPGRTRAGPLEVRLAAVGAGPRDWSAVLFGPGSWRQRTEDRAPPPALAPGDTIEFGGGLAASVARVSEVSPRLVGLRFDRDAEALWSALYRAGRPVQYSYLCGPLDLDHVQTAYGARPWSVEMPSAGRPLTVGLLAEIRRRGSSVVAITLGAGLSSTGDPVLDAALPLPEPYEIPAATAEAVQRTRATGGRVIAAGTTVVRALEGSAAAHGGALVAGTGVTAFRVSAGFEPLVVDGLLTGLHEPGTTHFEVMAAFASAPLLAAAYRHAEAAGYLAHEFGDSCLVLGGGVLRAEPRSPPRPSSR